MYMYGITTIPFLCVLSGIKTLQLLLIIIGVFFVRLLLEGGFAWTRLTLIVVLEMVFINASCLKAALLLSYISCMQI